mmetsp:Transcript_30356/g.80736  ORF Transcript_30356/g.80736 Transcript_30356/m.80736 type:complete len:219 (+) Transcript_30356:956-1612(+)
MALHKIVVLLTYLLLQRSRLVEHDCKLASHLRNLLLRFHAILCMLVSVHAHGIIQILLLITLRLDGSNLLIQLSQSAALQLHLLLSSKIFGVGLGQLYSVLLALLLKIYEALIEILGVVLPTQNVFPQIHCLCLLPLHEVDLFFLCGHLPWSHPCLRCRALAKDPRSSCGHHPHLVSAHLSVPGCPSYLVSAGCEHFLPACAPPRPSRPWPSEPHTSS